MALQDRKIAATLVALSAFVPNLFLIGDSWAQATATETLSISASVVNPLQIIPSIAFSLNFKAFAVKGTGSYLIQPGGTATINSGVTLSSGGIGTVKVSVPQNATFTLSIPTYKTGDSIILTHSGGGVPSKEMTAKSILFAGKSGITGVTGTMSVFGPSIAGAKVTNPANTGRFSLGARLLFGANQVTGLYTGTYILRITL